jgi:peptidoglycan/LPS O-acetylase OafA/YrhL
MNLNLTELNNLNRYLGLGLFVFLLGYFVDLKGSDFSNPAHLLDFFKKKFLRIFPLYYLALAAFFLMLKQFNLSLIVSHIFGLQLITATKGFEPIASLWFIGLVVVYYAQFIIFRIAASLGQNSRMPKYKNLKLFINCFVTFFPLIIVVLNKFTHFVDPRLSLYYGCFWFGVLCSKRKVLEKIDQNISLLLFPLVITLYLFLHTHFGAVLGKFTIDYYVIDDIGDFAGKSIIANIIMFSFILSSYTYTKILSKKLTENLLVAVNLITTISYSSYCIYLFHLPIWFSIGYVNRKFMIMEDEKIFGVVLIIIGVPITIFISRAIQSTYDKFCRSLLSRST